MDIYTPEDTISNSKEESLAKAISLIQGNQPTRISLTRPNISTSKVIVAFVLWLFAIVAFVFLCLLAGRFFHFPTHMVHPVATFGCLLTIWLKAKAMVRNAILLYQKHAPEKMRKACLFVPSCSEYMLLSVEKHGVIVGVCKGLRRLSRCRPPNGGNDFP